MEKTVVVTSIYKDFEDSVSSTYQFRKSVERVGLPLINAWESVKGVPVPWSGDGYALFKIYGAYLTAKEQGYTHAIYADGADSYFLRKPHIPEDFILYSTEKAMWPPTPDVTPEYKKAILGWEHLKTPWKYINGGGCCGPIDLLIQFFEKYNLNGHAGNHINGQGQLADSFFRAKADKFTITLDFGCLEFQTTGFEDPGDFGIEKYMDRQETFIRVKNNLTGSYPAVLHGNGRTDMHKWYKLLNL